MSAKLMKVCQAAGVVTLIAVATFLASAKLGHPTTGIDDADIFLVYARNVSAGEGFVFNHAGERVEGFTSLLWVLACSVFVRISAAPERWLLGLNVLLLCFTVLTCLRSTVLRTPGSGGGMSPASTSIFLVLLLADFRYVFWNTIALMETALWGALLTAAAIHLCEVRHSKRRHDGQFAVLIGLLVVTRPEALVWALVLCALLFWKHVQRESWVEGLRSTAPSIVAFVGTTVLLTAFRLAYFGFPLPNTYYAKLSPSLEFRLGEGLEYAIDYIWSGPSVAACVLALILSVLHLAHVRLRDERTMILTVLASTWIVVPVLTGGDHFEGFRFYQPALPIGLLTLVNLMRVVLPNYLDIAASLRSRHIIQVAGFAFVMALVLTVQTADWIQFEIAALETEFTLSSSGRQKGADANALFEPRGVLPDIGTIAVGGFRHAYKGNVIDLMGLNGTRMAHNGGNRIGVRSHAAFEKSTFYELNPTIVLPLAQYSGDLESARRRIVFVDRALKGIHVDRRFQEKYRLAEVRGQTSKGPVALAAWYDVEFLGGLKQSGEFEIIEATPERAE